MKRRIRNNKKLNNTSKQKLSFSSWRYNLIFFIFLFSIGAIFNRLFNLQIIQHAEMKEKANEQYQFFEKLKPNRGQIFIKDGEENLITVGTNEERNTVVIIPKYIEDIEGTVQMLSETLEMDSEEIRNKVMKRDDPYEIIKRKISNEASEIIEERDMDGINLVSQTWRNYPENHFAAQIIGFVSNRGEVKLGQYGIEEYFNELLEGESGFMKSEKDTLGRWISINKRILEEPKDGADLVLTIDQTIQHYSEELIYDSVLRYGAESGSIIVMDPNNGKIIAMANYPTYNNNKFSAVEDPNLFKNPCIQDAFEPGSIFKPITVSIPMDMGRINPSTVYHDKGYYDVDEYTIKNSDEKAYGDTTMTEFLELSLNTGAIWSMEQAGQKNFFEYLKKFGLGRKTDIELTGESSGNIRNLEYNRKVNYATASFGQGITVTPIQLVGAFSTLINGGKLYKPQIIEKVIYSDGEEESREKEVVRQVISSDVSNNLRAMLISVVKNGWGRNASVPGYLIGGKTGTAQVPDPYGKGYSDDTIHSFIGFGPGQDPRFVTLIKLDKVSGVDYAADSAAVTTGKLNKFLLEHYQIFPAEEVSDKEVQKYEKLMEENSADISHLKVNNPLDQTDIDPENDEVIEQQENNDDSEVEENENNN